MDKHRAEINTLQKQVALSEKAVALEVEKKISNLKTEHEKKMASMRRELELDAQVLEKEKKILNEDKSMLVR